MNVSYKRMRYAMLTVLWAGVFLGFQSQAMPNPIGFGKKAVRAILRQSVGTRRVAQPTAQQQTFVPPTSRNNMNRIMQESKKENPQLKTQAKKYAIVTGALIGGSCALLAVAKILSVMSSK